MENRQPAPADVPLIGLQAFALDADFSAQGIALHNILRQRHSQRQIAPDPLPQYRLSRLLWAACGCNRDGAQLRTASSICGGVAIDLYVAVAGGLYRFDATRMVLARCSEEDLRSRGGDGAPMAPLELIYVADMARMAGVPAQDRQWQAALDAGFMAQNVSLFCTAEDLATYMQVPPERAALAKAMKLGGGECVLLLQPVGMPRDAAPRDPWM